MRTKTKKTLKFIWKHKIEFLLSLLAVLGWLVAVKHILALKRTENRMRQLNQETEQRVYNMIKHVEATSYALSTVHPTVPIDHIDDLSFCKKTLKNNGINSVGELIRDIRINKGTEFLKDLPGIGPESYYRILHFLRYNSTKTFRNLYLN